MTKRYALFAASVAIGFACSVAAASCQLTKVAEWPVRLERNKLIVDGAINGQKIGVLLDTGASTTLIFRAAAARLGLALREVRNYRVVGVGGETNVESANIDEFRVGQSVRKNWRMLVAGERDPGGDVAVLLGEDFFQMFDIEFDLPHKMVRLYQPKDCDGVSLAYWASAGAGEVGFEEVDARHPKIVVPVSINGQSTKALLDSGAGLSLLDKAEAARLGVTPETPGVIATSSGVGLGTKSVESWIGPFQSFTIGDETIRNTEIRFSDWRKDLAFGVTGSRLPTKLLGLPSMLLGADFLRSHRLLVAHSQRKIYFTHAGGPVFQLNRPPVPQNDPRPEDKAKPAPGEN